MRKVERLAGLIMILVGVAILAAVAFTLLRIESRRDPQPSGIWAGIVDDLPSGRLVECVFARDPSGSVAVTCDWQNAVVRGRP